MCSQKYHLLLYTLLSKGVINYQSPSADSVICTIPLPGRSYNYLLLEVLLGCTCGNPALEFESIQCLRYFSFKVYLGKSSRKKLEKDQRCQPIILLTPNKISKYNHHCCFLCILLTLAECIFRCHRKRKFLWRVQSKTRQYH